MKRFYEHGIQTVGCCKEEEKGHFHPTLGKTWVLPITPGLPIQETPSDVTVIEIENRGYGSWMPVHPFHEVNMSLTVDTDSEDEESEGENGLERWLFDTGA
jgi:hypothetical protein